MKSKQTGKSFHSSCPTKRAPDAGDSAAISISFLRLIIFPVGQRVPPPAPARVTQTVGRLDHRYKPYF